MPSDQSKIFDKNFMFFKFFGIYPGRTSSKYYKYYSIVNFIVNFALYNILLALHLLYTPWKVELILRDVMFFLTEITVASKILTILFMRDKLVGLLNLIDCDEFVGDYENKNGMLYKINKKYNLFLKCYFISSNVSYTCQVFIPILLTLIRKTKPELPICRYDFLSDEVRESFFVFIFIYQSFGMYGHLIYNVTIDMLTGGLLVLAIAQLRLLNINLNNLKVSKEERKLPIEIQDKIQCMRLNRLLRHYEVILDYCKSVQDFLSPTLFFQFSVASILICVALCGLLLPSSTEDLVCLVIYFLTVKLQIFVPGFLGTQLTYESTELATAAYNTEWIPRSELFKRSLRLFMERAGTPIIISGLKMFPLSLITFTSIMKTAYSFFTLIRNIQEA